MENYRLSYNGTAIKDVAESNVAKPGGEAGAFIACCLSVQSHITR